MIKGDIDMYWEYTGTGWVNILGHTTTNVPTDLYQKVAAEDKAKHNVAWLKPAPMNDTYAIATTKDFSYAEQRHHDERDGQLREEQPGPGQDLRRQRVHQPRRRPSRRGEGLRLQVLAAWSSSTSA